MTLLSMKPLLTKKSFRKEIISESFVEAGINPNDLDAVVGRGGLIAPLEGGTYEVNTKMLEDLKVNVGQHVSNLGGMIAKKK